MNDYVSYFDRGFLDLIPIRKGDKRPRGPWATIRADRASVAAWQTGNLGLRTANYPCVDIDVRDAVLSDLLAELARDTLGPAPSRVGQAPKQALLYKTTRPFSKRWIVFEDSEGETHRVEVLGNGQYVVIAGTHPSGAPYSWDAEPSVGSLAWVTDQDVDRFLDEAAKLVEQHGCLVTGHQTSRGSETAPPQEDLAADDPELIAKAMAMLPNTERDFPNREDYLAVGIALKASLPHDEGTARDLFAEWCGRWEGGHNDPATVERDWESLHPPFHLGANYIIDLARAYGGLETAADDFDALLDSPPEARSGGGDEADGTAVRYSHGWLADAFLSRHGEHVRFCDQLGGWLRWDGIKWAGDDLRVVHHDAATVCREAGSRALEALSNPKEAEATARQCASVRTVRDVLAYASFDPRVSCGVGDFDQHEWLLNTPSGIVDLKSGATEGHVPALRLTKASGVAPNSESTPLWDAFLTEATGNDPALVGYLQRLVGYCLTGSTREHVLAFFWGPGGNGKGVFLNTIVRVLGDYAAVSAMDTFTASRGDRHPADVAALAGARLVTSQETQEGRSWDEAKIKAITGGDPVSARFMGKDFFTFTPQFKLLFAGNHRPKVANLDAAMRRRFHLVPFTAQPKAIDHELQEKLLGELGGILQWAIEGCLAWQEQGLNPPAVVLDATEQYFVDEDPVGRWLDDMTFPGTEVTSTKDLYDSWSRWCTDQGEQVGTLRTLSNALRSRGMEAGRTATTRGYRLSLKDGPTKGLHVVRDDSDLSLVMGE